MNIRNRYQLSENTRLELLTASTEQRSKGMEQESVDDKRKIKEDTREHL